MGAIGHRAVRQDQEAGVVDRQAQAAVVLGARPAEWPWSFPAQWSRRFFQVGHWPTGPRSLDEFVCSGFELLVHSTT